MDDERSPGVAQAGVVLAGLVPGAEHLGVELRNAKVNGRHNCQSLRLAICLMSFMLRAAGRDVSFEGHEKCLSRARRCKQMICGAEYGSDCFSGGQCHCVAQLCVSVWWRRLVNA